MDSELGDLVTQAGLKFRGILAYVRLKLRKVMMHAGLKLRGIFAHARLKLHEVIAAVAPMRGAVVEISGGGNAR
jgi:hypothetical protein